MTNSPYDINDLYDSCPSILFSEFVLDTVYGCTILDFGDCEKVGYKHTQYLRFLCDFQDKSLNIEELTVCNIDFALNAFRDCLLRQRLKFAKGDKILFTFKRTTKKRMEIINYQILDKQQVF